MEVFNQEAYKARLRQERLNPDLKKTADMLFVCLVAIETEGGVTENMKEEVRAHLKKLTKERKWKP